MRRISQLRAKHRGLPKGKMIAEGDDLCLCSVDTDVEISVTPCRNTVVRINHKQQQVQECKWYYTGEENLKNTWSGQKSSSKKRKKRVEENKQSACKKNNGQGKIFLCNTNDHEQGRHVEDT